MSVSADIVVGLDETATRELAAGYGPRVRGIRTGRVPRSGAGTRSRLDRRRQRTAKEALEWWTVGTGQ